VIEVKTSETQLPVRPNPRQATLEGITEQADLQDEPRFAA
jgi:hypothetical protein